MVRLDKRGIALIGGAAAAAAGIAAAYFLTREIGEYELTLVADRDRVTLGEIIHLSGRLTKKTLTGKEPVQGAKIRFRLRVEDEMSSWSDYYTTTDSNGEYTTRVRFITDQHVERSFEVEVYLQAGAEVGGRIVVESDWFRILVRGEACQGPFESTAAAVRVNRILGRWRAMLL